MSNEITFRLELKKDGIFKTYKVDDKMSLQICYNHFIKVLKELKLPTDRIKTEVYSSTHGLNNNNVKYLSDFYDIEEKTEVDLNIIIALYDHYKNIEIVREILSNDENYDLYYSMYGESIFYVAYEGDNTFDCIPDELIDYINYESYYRDIEKENGQFTIAIEDRIYITVEEENIKSLKK